MKDFSLRYTDQRLVATYWGVHISTDPAFRHNYGTAKVSIHSLPLDILPRRVKEYSLPSIDSNVHSPQLDFTNLPPYRQHNGEPHFHTHSHGMTS